MAKKKKKNIAVVESNPVQPQIAEGEEIMALVDSIEKANQIANELGIALVKFSQGVATYHTTKDPVTVVQNGRNRGYDVGLNTIQNLIEPINNRLNF